MKKNCSSLLKKVIIYKVYNKILSHFIGKEINLIYIKFGDVMANTLN